MLGSWLLAVERLGIRGLIPDPMLPMTHGQRLTLLLPLAYLLGSIPFGMVVGRMKGVDPTRHGSGNIGATNVGRLLGRKYFFIVFFLDMFKGLLPMLMAAVLLSDHPNAGGFLPAKLNVFWLLIGFAAIGGHMFSVFLKFKGGKGIATSLGVMLGLFPYFTLPGLLVFLLWVLIFLPTRYVSLASILGAAAFPFVYMGVGRWRGWPIFNQQLPLTVFSIVLAILIVYKHRSNIKRLLAGKEQHFHPAKKKSRKHHHHSSEADASAGNA